MSLAPARARASCAPSAAARLRCGAQGGHAPAAPRPLPRPPCTPPRQGRAPNMRLPAAHGGGLYEGRGGCSRSVGGLVALPPALRHYAPAASLPPLPPHALLAARPAHPLGPLRRRRSPSPWGSCTLAFLLCFCRLVGGSRAGRPTAASGDGWPDRPPASSRRCAALPCRFRAHFLAAARRTR